MAGNYYDRRVNFDYSIFEFLRIFSSRIRIMSELKFKTNLDLKMVSKFCYVCRKNFVRCAKKHLFWLTYSYFLKLWHTASTFGLLSQTFSCCCSLCHTFSGFASLSQLVAHLIMLTQVLTHFHILSQVFAHFAIISQVLQ